jgi:hypothetical protein
VLIIERDCCGLVDVHFAPNGNQIPQRSDMTRFAMNGSERTHSITSSVSDSKVGGTALPSSLAVFQIDH